MGKTCIRLGGGIRLTKPRLSRVGFSARMWAPRGQGSLCCSLLCLRHLEQWLVHSRHPVPTEWIQWNHRQHLGSSTGWKWQSPQRHSWEEIPKEPCMGFVLFPIRRLSGSSLSRTVLRFHSVVILVPPSLCSWCWVLSLCPIAVILDTAMWAPVARDSAGGRAPPRTLTSVVCPCLHCRSLRRMCREACPSW